MPQALISIIIPMYKVESYLPQCISILQRQTYRPLEVIFVDDASPDNSATLVEEALPRLAEAGIDGKLLRQGTNQGVAAARNRALDAATGKYIYSLDADDTLEEDALRQMVEIAEGEQADVVGCECYLREPKAERRLTQPDPKTGREAYALMCAGRMKWNLWLFLVRRELFGADLKFTPGDNMGEDMMMMGRVMLRAEKVRIIHEAFYHYDRTNVNAQTQNYSPAQWAQVQRNLSKLEHYVSALSNPALLVELQQMKLNLKLPLLISTKQADYDLWSELWPEANAHINELRHLPLRTRMIQHLAHRKQWALLRLYNRVVMQWLYSIIYR